MGTNYIAPIWRMPRNANKDKLSNYSIDFRSGNSARYINCGTDLFTGSTIPSISISVWIKTTIGLNGNAIISKDLATSGNRNFLLQFSGNDLYWQTSVDGNTLQFITVPNSTFNLLDGEWHHIVATYEAGSTSGTAEKKIYIDGAVQSTDPAATLNNIVNTTSVPIEIARRGDGNRYYSGEISQCCIFDYALDLDQVNYLYNLNNPMAITGAEPIAYWPLGDNSNPNAPGSFPNISVGADSVFEFDALNNEKITASNITSLNTGDLSASIWFYATNSGNNIEYLFDNSNALATAGFTIAINSSNGYAWYIGRATTTHQYLISNTDINFNNNVWNHLCFSYDDTTKGFVLYLNGDSVNSGTATSVTKSPSTNPITIGGQHASYDFTGELSNAQIWDTALEPSDVDDLYNNGQPLMTGTQPQEANLKAWYKLNQSANWEADTASNWQIPDNRSAYPQSFDFVSAGGDRVLVAPVDAGTGPINSINGAMTVAIWVKTTQGTSYSYAFNRDYIGGSNRDWNLTKDNFYGGGGRMMWSLFNTSGSNLLVRLTGSTDPQGNPLITMNDGKWHHIVGVYNGTDTAELYTDGILQGSAISSGFGNLRTNARTVIGGYNNSGNPYAGGGSWNGGLSNAQIWNTNLNATQVETLYNNGVPLTTAIASDNLKGWYKLDNNEIFDGTNWEVENQAYPAGFDSTLRFTTTAGITATSPIISNSTTHSTSWWAKYDVYATREDLILTTSSLGGYLMYVNNGGLIAFRPTTGSALTSAPNGTYKAITNTNTDKWYHYVFIRNGGNVKLYENNIKVWDTTMTAGTESVATNFIQGFASKQSYTGSTSNYSNFSFFDTAIGEDDVQALYNNGTPLTDVSSLTAMNNWYKLDNLTSGLQDSVGSNNATATGTVAKVNTFVSTEAATSSGMTEQNLVNNNVSALNGESSGMNTTNLVQSNLTRKQPFSSYSINFDYSGGDYMQTTAGSNSILSGATSFTISAWVNFSDLSSGSGLRLIAHNWHNSSTSYNYIFRYYLGQLQLFVHANGSTGNAAYSFTPTLNTWYHVLGTWVGGTIQLYLNGASVGTPGSRTGTIPTITTSELIGKYTTSGTDYFMDGKISNLAYWKDTALSLDDILNIYNNGVPQDLNNFRITPTAWYPMDGSYTYYNGSVLVARDVISAKDATGQNIIQENIVGNAPGSEASGSGNNLTIADLKGNMYNSDKNAYSINMADYADGVTNPANSGRSTDTP